jgi:hypothetical protein
MKYPDTLDAPEKVTFDGISYRLMGTRRYYLSQSTSNKGRRRAKGLHVAIWEAYNGEPMPKGHHCHHRDGNPFNNAPENLEAVTQAEHSAHHPFVMTEKQREHLDRVRDMTKEWHASPEGIAWHRENGKRQWEGKEPRELPCARCGKIMKTRAAERLYCDSWCNFLALRETGKYDREIVCAWCDAKFTCRPSNPGKYPLTCGKSCQLKLVWAKRSRSQP